MTSINIPKNVRKIDSEEFGKCPRLTNVYLPDNLTEIGDGCFSSCYSLSNILIPKNVTKIAYNSFDDCSSLSKIQYQDKTYSLADIYDLYDDINFGVGNKLLIENNALKSASPQLTEITIPDGVTYIDDYAFFDCANLTKVTIPSSVTRARSNAFSNCPNLTDITFNGKTYNYKSIGELCDDINFSDKDMLIEDGVLIRISPKLASVVIPDGITKIAEDAFLNNQNLTSVVIPNTVKSIGACSFMNCTNLPNIVLPEGLIEIGLFAFDGCINLSNIDIPDSVEHIGYYSFNNCISLDNIKYKNKVYDNTNIDEIYNYSDVDFKQITWL